MTKIASYDPLALSVLARFLSEVAMDRIRRAGDAPHQIDKELQAIGFTAEWRGSVLYEIQPGEQRKTVA